MVIIQHALHRQHPLKLIRHEGVAAARCRGCKKDIVAGRISYACRVCRFYLHEPCSKLSPLLHHFLHPCLLFLRIDNFTCNACFEDRSGFTYRCEPCDFNMDVECALLQLPSTTSCDVERERIRHCSHRHLLQLTEETNSLFLCRICNKSSSSGPVWCCEPCDFRVHKVCLEVLPSKVQTKLDSKLRTLVLVTSPSEFCDDCKGVSDLVFRVYGLGREHLCISCCLVRRMVGESPSPLALVIDHFLHPCPLRLVFSPLSTCNACFRNDHEFFYHCKLCDFFLHLECVQSPAAHRPDQIQHFCHPHLLELFQDPGDHSETLCRLCESSLSGSFYGCRQCQFYIHGSCMESLPQKTNHHLLNQTVVFLTIPSFKCSTCDQDHYGIAYRCSESRIDCCVKCVIWPENRVGVHGGFTSIHHWHQLTAAETEQVHQARCFMCGECCSGPTYICSRCNIFFHKQCAELPPELQIPLHPKHRLILHSYPRDQSGDCCNLCLKSIPQNSSAYNGYYCCVNCDLRLDSYCTSRLPSLRYQRHEHLLTIVENIYGEAWCYVCRKSCKDVTLRCAECNFSLHLECGPLPCSIKSIFHVHPLVLKDYYVEDNEADKFACHVCEEVRDPRNPVYCCAEDCLMICDAKCLPAEVLPILRGEHGCVETRTRFPNVECEVVSKKVLLKQMETITGSSKLEERNRSSNIMNLFGFRELFDSFMNSAFEEEEEETLGIEYLEAGYEQNDSLSTRGEEEDDDPDETKSLSTDGATILGNEVGSQINSDETSYLYSLEALSSFKKHLHSPAMDDTLYGFFDWWRYDGRIMIGEYALPQALFPLYEQLFGKNKIVDEKCKLSYPKKRYLIFVVCCVVEDMRMIKVLDASKERILNWLGWIRYVEAEGGLDLRFVVEIIERIWEAHFVIEARRLVDQKSDELSQELGELSQEAEELAKKLEATLMKIQEKKKEEAAHKAYRAARASGLKKKYKDALEIKWRTCGDCVLQYTRDAEVES